MNRTHRISDNTALTRLIQFFFALILLFAGLGTTGCGLLDTNNPDTGEFVVLPEATAGSVYGLPETKDRVAQPE